ncbi:hypothetical protein MTR67_017505 [Solanum verrucosum]|uniref:Uncharacterized protein n=1 Tax=Solanum verrucosum TaxID=315347 RepID=A0AAF0QMY4_SOLVR|nr:hypothetical protein MTR67_017505 [Solanum verrucosum]
MMHQELVFCLVNGEIFGSHFHI